jgi:hypothetical protein
MDGTGRFVNCVTETAQAQFANKASELAATEILVAPPSCRFTGTGKKFFEFLISPGKSYACPAQASSSGGVDASKNPLSLLNEIVSP